MTRDEFLVWLDSQIHEIEQMYRQIPGTSGMPASEETKARLGLVAAWGRLKELKFVLDSV